MTRTHARTGFTLVELLVGLSIAAALAGFVLIAYPGARDQDRVRTALTDVIGHLRMAQGMAARDKAPRGIRFIADGTGKPNGNALLSTELQYVELPPPLIPNRSPLTSGNPDTEPRVRFQYKFMPAGAINAGAINERHCTIENLNADQLLLVQSGCTLELPVFGSWHKITKATPLSGSSVEVELEVYPDASMGGSTHALLYHFAIHLLAVPLVGEPTVLIPQNICVDLSVPDTTHKVGSLGPNGAGDFNVIFGPDGRLVNNSQGQLFLLVRNYSKVPSMRFPDGLDLANAFQRSGELHFLTIRSSGVIGHNLVAWPNMPGGTYADAAAPFALARQELNP